MLKNQKGFTLIELLVVIAIIGILSSVVLASLNTAREKGANANVKANLANMMVQAEVIYDDATGIHKSTYDEVCGANTATQNSTITNAITSADNASGGSAVCGKPTTGQADAWAVSSPLKGQPAATDNWCVDSTGVAKAIAAPIGATVVVCP